MGQEKDCRGKPEEHSQAMNERLALRGCGGNMYVKTLPSVSYKSDNLSNYITQMRGHTSG